MKKIIFALAFLPLVLFTACSSEESHQDNPEMEQVIVITRWVNNDIINGFPSKTRIVFTSFVDMLIAVDDGKDGLGAFGVKNLEFCKYTRRGNKISTKINGKDVVGDIRGDIITFTYHENGLSKKIIFSQIKEGSLTATLFLCPDHDIKCFIMRIIHEKITFIRIFLIMSYWWDLVL